jgi:hypothetical protein
MLSSIWLLTATCLANDPAPTLYPVPATATPAPYCSRCAAEADQGHGLGLGRRLANLLHGRRRPSAAVIPAGESIYQSPEPALAQEPALITQAIHETVEPAAAGAPATPKETVERVAIADDASWIIGQLTYVHADGGIWVVRYAPLDREDRFGGAVVLAPGPDMNKYREGDIVFVKGAVINEGRSSKHLGAPLYRVTSIDLNERPEE